MCADRSTRTLPKHVVMPTNFTSARDGIGQRHRIVHSHIQIKDQLLDCHCSTPLLRLYRLTKPMFNFGARGNRLLSAQARHRHCRSASTRGHALKERGKPSRRAAANAPINVSPAAVVSTTALESAGMRSSSPPSPSVTEPAPPSVMTAAPAPLASRALSAATQLASSAGKIPVSTWHSVSLGQARSTGRPDLRRQLAGGRWIKDRIEPQLMSANKRLGRKVTFALGDKDASGSRGNLAGVAVRPLGHQTPQRAGNVRTRKRMVGAR